MMIITYIASAVILLGLCIFIHELGHLLGGKMVGIKARVFSMGYGRGILKKKIGDTTYQVTLIPFGGYCQFYGEDPSEKREGKGFEFLSAAPWRRIVTVLMGPLFNLFFGIILFYIMNLTGYTKETNRISIPEQITTGSYISSAYKAGMRDGDTITAINGKTVTGFDDIQAGVVFSSGEALEIEVSRDGNTLSFSVVPDKSPDSGRYVIGVLPYGSRTVVGGLVPGEPAEKAGLAYMDHILEVDGKKVSSPDDFTSYLKGMAGKTVKVAVMREDEKVDIELTPRKDRSLIIGGETVAYSGLLKQAVKEMDVTLDGKTVYSFDSLMEEAEKNTGKEVKLKIRDAELKGPMSVEDRGFAGIYPALAPDMVEVQYGALSGLARAVVEPYDFIVMNLKGLGMMFSGGMSVRENVSGPIRIAKIAGDVAYYKGLSAFILLMAKISIILMVMNLLPIPAVDGSHIVFYTIEAIRGKPLKKEIMERIQTAGVLILIVLGVAVILNDISMLPFLQNLFR